MMGMNKRNLHYLKCKELKTTSSPVDIHHRGEAPSDIIVHTVRLSWLLKTLKGGILAEMTTVSGHSESRQSSIPIHSQSPAPEIEIPLGGFIIFSSLDWPYQVYERTSCDPKHRFVSVQCHFFHDTREIPLGDLLRSQVLYSG